MNYLLPASLSLNKKNKQYPNKKENKSKTFEDDFENIIKNVIEQKQKNNLLTGIELNSLHNHIQNIKLLRLWKFKTPT